jgi:hypothetical protein
MNEIRINGIDYKQENGEWFGHFFTGWEPVSDPRLNKTPPTKPTSARENSTERYIAVEIIKTWLLRDSDDDAIFKIESLILAHTEHLQKRIEELEKALDGSKK